MTVLVTVIRTNNRYRRSVNGAWLSAGADRTEYPGVPLHQVPLWTVGDGHLDVVFEDGTKEVVYCHSSCMPGYPPSVQGKRLAAAFDAAGVKFNPF